MTIALENNRIIVKMRFFAMLSNARDKSSIENKAKFVIPIIHHSDYRIGLSRTGAHRESKYAALFDYLVDHSVIKSDWVSEPEMISREDLATVHDQAYLDAVFNLSLSESELRRIGLARVPELVTRPRRSCGGTLLAAHLALQEGVACNTAGGSHHAHAGFGSGFCVFNDIAVASATLLRDKIVSRVLVVDLDVHQGDGTAAIFEDDMAVHTFSMHCEKNFPARKQISDLDIALDKDTEDQSYLGQLYEFLPKLIMQHQPDIIFYLAGVDTHVDDKLGYLSLTDNGIRQREQFVLKSARDAGIPIVTVVGGGYGDDRHIVARRHAVVIEEAVNIF